MALQVCVKVVFLMYISPCNVSIWTLDIDITKPKCRVHEFLTIQQIISFVFHQIDSVKE